jgi:hypothetical protein
MEMVGLAWFALCFGCFLYRTGGVDICHTLQCLEIVLILTSIFYDTIYAEIVGQGRPEAVGDTRGPSLRHDEDCVCRAHAAPVLHGLRIL